MLPFPCLLETRSRVVFSSSKQDDPQRRLPDISKAVKYLDWKPKVPLIQGLQKTIDFYRYEISRNL